MAPFPVINAVNPSILCIIPEKKGRVDKYFSRAKAITKKKNTFIIVDPVFLPESRFIPRKMAPKKIISNALRLPEAKIRTNNGIKKRINGNCFLYII